MKEQAVKPEMIEEYRKHLIEEEKSKATIEKYIHDIRHFYQFLSPGKTVTKELMITYKGKLLDHYKISSANSMLVSVNSFFAYLGWNDFKLKAYKCQQELMVESERELVREEYQRLVKTARNKGNPRLYYILQTLCATGIRISELSFITIESVKAGKAQVQLKGKNRVVIIEKKLRKELLKYCKSQGITAGCVFITSSGKPVDRSNVWREMKKLSAEAKVSRQKVYPHNLRHLFARTYYKMYKDIVYLADILGHSSINTTRIYTSASRKEHERILSSLNLVTCHG